MAKKVGLDPAIATPRDPGSVQSIARAFRLLEITADHGGSLSLSQLAAESGLPMPTIHRLLRTLVGLGYMRQEPSKEYVLGPRLMRLGESSSRMLAVWARPHLSVLVEKLGETANLAMLDGDEIIYIAQVPSKHSMRMFTEVGRRVQPHCTAVGKAIMAQLPRETVHALLARTGMARHTDNTITELTTFDRQLDLIERAKYAIDDGEQEVGVRCVAVVVPDFPSRLAVSISGPAARMTDRIIEHAVPLLTEAGLALSRDLS